jgi:hypothetical protein
VIVACDGIWDEIENDEAAHLYARILVENQFDPTANIAQLFIDEVMKLAAHVRKTPSHTLHMNAWASLHILGQPRSMSADRHSKPTRRQPIVLR